MQRWERERERLSLLYMGCAAQWLAPSPSIHGTDLKPGCNTPIKMFLGIRMNDVPQSDVAVHPPRVSPLPVEYPEAWRESAVSALCFHDMEIYGLATLIQIMMWNHISYTNSHIRAELYAYHSFNIMADCMRIMLSWHGDIWPGHSPGWLLSSPKNYMNHNVDLYVIIYHIIVDLYA